LSRYIENWRKTILQRACFSNIKDTLQPRPATAYVTVYRSADSGKGNRREAGDQAIQKNGTQAGHNRFCGNLGNLGNVSGDNNDISNEG
jgi:hypothetical protein